MSEPFYITTAIAYPNGRPHIGHAYEAIAADVIARFMRAQGRDVRLVTGTDEHGEKIAEAAAKAGETPRTYVDRIAATFKATWPVLAVEPDYIIRTTDPDHVKTVQDILRGDLLSRVLSGIGGVAINATEGTPGQADEATGEAHRLGLPLNAVKDLYYAH